MKKYFVLIAFLLAVISINVFAAQNAVNQIINKDEVRENIVFSAGQVFNNNGTINNDIFMAGQSISNNGTVNGDIFAAGQDIMVGGAVSGSVRAAGQSISLRGNILRNVLVFGNTITLEKDSVVEGTVNANGNIISINGTIKKGLKAAGASVLIDGTITGDVSIDSPSITITPGSKIDGNLFYKSATEQVIPADVVTGKVDKKIVVEPVKPIKDTKKTLAHNVKSEILWLLGSFLLGVVLIKLFRKFVTNSASSIKTSWGKYLGIGILSLITPPIAFIMLLVTIIGIPIGLAGIIIYALMLYIAKIPVSIFIGELILKNRSIYIKLLLGLIILSVLYLIPWVGCLVCFAVTLLGLGSLVYNSFFAGGKAVATK